MIFHDYQRSTLNHWSSYFLGSPAYTTIQPSRKNRGSAGPVCQATSPTCSAGRTSLVCYMLCRNLRSGNPQLPSAFLIKKNPNLKTNLPYKPESSAILGYLSQCEHHHSSYPWIFTPGNLLKLRHRACISSSKLFITRHFTQKRYKSS